jgi:DNA-binding MarR family transcriptional regulator
MKRDAPAPEEADPKRADLGVVDALAQLSFAVQAALGQVAVAHDLSIIQTRLLGVLRDRTVGMNELARYLGLDKSSVTGLVDRAELRGLVRRKTSSTDRRAVEVSITPAGRKLVQQGADDFAQRIAALVGPLSATERGTLSALVTRILVAAAGDEGIAL